MPAVLNTTFDEEVLGGADNTNSESLYVERDGNLVVTAIATASGQILDSNDSTAPARRLGVSALRHATAAS